MIAPALAKGETVLVSAHGNSLRALVKHLSNIADDEITGLEIPTGQPIVYELDDSLAARERYYLAALEAVNYDSAQEIVIFSDTPGVLRANLRTSARSPKSRAI
jgi:bisphosphoglycerate-dependent phosphoglycerate mutase family 1